MDKKASQLCITHNILSIKFTFRNIVRELRDVIKSCNVLIKLGKTCICKSI